MKNGSNDARACRRVHADAGVAHRQHHVAAGPEPRVAAADARVVERRRCAVSIVSARRRHRVARVDRRGSPAPARSGSGSACTRDSAGVAADRRVDVLADQRAAASAAGRDDVVEVEDRRGCRNCLRLNASSCRVSAAPRSAAFRISLDVARGRPADPSARADQSV